MLVYYTYILKSRVKNRTYTGSTNDVKRRLEEHNSGKVKSSKPCKPYDILHIEIFSTEREAKQREVYLKTTNGRREIKKIIARRSG